MTLPLAFEKELFSNRVLGFWIYLMTDCILFGTLFATYAVLHNSTFGGPADHDIYNLHTVIAETAVLLLSSIACGFSVLAPTRARLLGWLTVAFILGASFVAMELHEFHGLIVEGNSWEKSAFLTSFFTLVGTHGLHVTIGLFWMIVVMTQIMRQGVTIHTFRRLVLFSMFWHFLDLIWIFIFTFVYLMGVS